jgi:hypothetical protein
VLSAAKNGTASPHDPLERVEEDQLRDAAHDAFMAFWRGGQVELWAAYCEAQERYETYLLRRE